MRLAFFTLFLMTPLVTAQVKESSFGKLPDGREVKAYTLTNRNGTTAKVITYGAILTELLVPDRDGKLADVVLGYDNIEGYLKETPYFGANVGRCANRIAKGKFSLEGKDYTLATNNGVNHLHGGKAGFDKKLWTAAVLESNAAAVKFSYTSPDGEEGYPGELKISVTYTLTADNELKLHFEATTDKMTLCNPAHHSYFNLAGHNSGDILKHSILIPATMYTPTDDTLIPTGIAPVAGTPFDFTTATEIGKRIQEIKADPVGYDLNYVVGAEKGKEKVIAVVTEPKTGRKVEVLSDKPGLQFYSGNFLDGKIQGKGNAVYNQYAAFCLEPQYFPDAIHHLGEKGWESPVLSPGQKYTQHTTYKFSVQK